MKALEEKIIEILDNNLDYKPHCITGMGTSAKEIASMMKEFIEWVDTEGYRFHSRHNIWCYENRIGVVRKTIDELFDYWLNNIKKWKENR
jgi:hypothetical protein